MVNLLGSYTLQTDFVIIFRLLYSVVFVLVISIHRNALDNLLLLNKYNNEASRTIHIPGVTINSPSFCLLNNYLYKLRPTEGKYKPRAEDNRYIRIRWLFHRLPLSHGNADIRARYSLSACTNWRSIPQIYFYSNEKKKIIYILLILT